MRATMTRMLTLVVIVVGSGCVMPGRYSPVGLQRSLFPGLEELPEGGIAGAFAQKVELQLPASAGLAWLTEDSDRDDGADGTMAFSGFERTGVTQVALAALRGGPLKSVGGLPTVPAMSLGDSKSRSDPVNSVRRACAHFQYDIAIILQTSVVLDSGYNVLAIGYLPVVTAPVFPGSDRAVAASAELIAIDVRTGVPLACGRGRDSDVWRFMFYWQADDKGRKLVEECVGHAISSAAKDLKDQLAARLGEKGSS